MNSVRTLEIVENFTLLIFSFRENKIFGKKCQKGISIKTVINKFHSFDFLLSLFSIPTVCYFEIVRPWTLNFSRHLIEMTSMIFSPPWPEVTWMLSDANLKKKKNELNGAKYQQRSTMKQCGVRFRQRSHAAWWSIIIHSPIYAHFSTFFSFHFVFLFIFSIIMLQ